MLLRKKTIIIQIQLVQHLQLIYQLQLNLPIKVNSIDTLNKENVDFFDYHYKWSNRYEYEIKKEETLLDKVVNYLNRETFMDIIN